MKIEECLDVIGRTAAWGWIVEQYLAGEPKCPGCGATIRTEKALATFFRLHRTWCRECNRVFTPTSGSPLAGTSWQPEEFLKFLILTLSGRTPVEIAQHLGKSASSVREMLAKVEVLQAGSPALFSGVTQDRYKKGARAAEGAGMKSVKPLEVACN